MTIDAVAQDGMFLVDNVTLYPDEQVGTELTPEADWKRRGMYMGPAVSPFEGHHCCSSGLIMIAHSLTTSMRLCRQTLKLSLKNVESMQA